jgi:hypothetical protein
MIMKLCCLKSIMLLAMQQHISVRNKIYMSAISEHKAYGPRGIANNLVWPPLWSSGQSSWLQIQRSSIPGATRFSEK